MGQSIKKVLIRINKNPKRDKIFNILSICMLGIIILWCLVGPFKVADNFIFSLIIVFEIGIAICKSFAKYDEELIMNNKLRYLLLSSTYFVNWIIWLVVILSMFYFRNSMTLVKVAILLLGIFVSIYLSKDIIEHFERKLNK